MRAIPILLLFVLNDVNASHLFPTGTLIEYSEPFIDGTDYHFVYAFDKGESFDKECEKITVKGAYVEKYWENHEGRISKLEHIRAMRFLAKKNNQKISFGIIGEGLKKLHSCRYFSRGLMLETHSEETTVYSVGKKLNKFKNENAASGSDASSTRPF